MEKLWRNFKIFSEFHCLMFQLRM